MDLTKEQLAKLAECETVEDVLAAAKDEGIDLTAKQAESLLSMNDEEVDEEQLKAVAGGCGGGGSDDSSPAYDTPSVCKFCGSTNIVVQTGNINGIEGTTYCACGNCGFIYWAEGC